MNHVCSACGRLCSRRKVNDRLLFHCRSHGLLRDIAPRSDIQPWAMPVPDVAVIQNRRMRREQARTRV